MVRRLPISVPKGITAILGSGGKTTLAHSLAEALDGTVIFTTTTRIFPSETMVVYGGADELTLAKLLQTHKKVCLGSETPQGKLGQPAIPMARLAQLADYVLVEADGSKNLPMKAHRDFEPVIPQETNLRILVVGASGFGKAIDQVCHCPQIFAKLADCDATQLVTAERLRAVVQRENLADVVVVNQCHSPVEYQTAKDLAAQLSIPVFCGSLWEHMEFKEAL